MKYIEAIQQALASAMRDDPSVVLLGEDIGVDGGVFRATDGLIDQFGAERVIDMPLAEAAIAGVSVGLAAQGIRPVAEIQFMGFAYPCLDQLANHASRLRNRTRGRLTCPLVMRVPYGGGIHAPEHHSESVEAMFAHIPGLRVVVASSPSRAYGLLLAAIQDPDPVVFLEPKRLYQTSEQVESSELKRLPLDQAVTLREGSDVTLLAWGAMVGLALEAADKLTVNNIKAEVIDVASLSILDMSTLSASVAKTGRCVIIHEAAGNGGFGAEIAARLADEDLLSLLAPVVRVTGFDTVMPLPKLEAHYMPCVERVLSGVQRVLAFS